MPRLSIVAATVALVLGAAAPAAAQDEEIAPPGNSGVDQYRETLPAPGGNRPTGAGRDRSPEQVLGKRNVQKLERFNEDGEAVAEAVAETAPVAVTGTGDGGAARPGGAGDGADRRAGGAAEEPTSSVLAEIAGQVTGADAEGGVGWLLPLVVGLAVIGGIIFAAGRRRAQRD